MDLRAKNKEQKESKIERVAAESEKQFDGTVSRRYPSLQKIKIKNNVPIPYKHVISTKVAKILCYFLKLLAIIILINGQKLKPSGLYNTVSLVSGFSR